MLEVISNTSCLIVLDNLALLDLLRQLYGNITISREVSEEFGGSLPSWINVKDVQNRKIINILNEIVDLGEAGTIALAMECNNHLIILDDNKARHLVNKLGLKYTGTIGVLIKSYQKGLITSIKDIAIRLKQNGFRLSDDLYKYFSEIEKQ